MTKGYHLHFGKIEMGLRANDEGKLFLELVSTKNVQSNSVNNAVRVFQGALASKEFRTELLEKLSKYETHLSTAYTGGNALRAAARIEENHRVIRSILNLYVQ